MQLMHLIQSLKCPMYDLETLLPLNATDTNYDLCAARSHLGRYIYFNVFSHTTLMRTTQPTDAPPPNSEAFQLAKEQV